LFSDFVFPCAYLAVKNLTGIQVSNAFWEGIHLLHRFGFNVVLSFCDGVSENRPMDYQTVQILTRCFACFQNTSQKFVYQIFCITVTDYGMED
jgi:hypothetical protein